MRIGIDITPAVSGKRYGVPYYVASLLQALLTGDGSAGGGAGDGLLDFTLTADHAPDEIAARLREVGVDPAARAARLVAEYTVAPRRHRRPDENRLRYLAETMPTRVLHPLAERLDDRSRRIGRDLKVFHHTDYYRPSWGGLPCAHVVTIHDAIAVKFPDRVSEAWVRFAERSFAFARESAAAVITYSESSRRDIVEHVEIPPERIHVIPLAVRPELLRGAREPGARAAREGEARARFGIGDDRFVLAVGRLDPMKNLGALIEAFAALSRVPELAGVRLVLAGPLSDAARGDGRAEVLAALRRHGVSEERCVLTGFVTDADLATLMGACACFAFPSLYEGFGLPPLEAMACGAPVVASRASSLPEVTGTEAALLVDPCDTDALADALRRVLADADLAARLRAAGPARAAQFSWERVAREHCRVYREAGAS